MEIVSHVGQRNNLDVRPSGDNPRVSRTILPGMNLFRIGASTAMNTTLLDQTEQSGAHRLLVTSVLARASLVKNASEQPAPSADELWPDGNRQAILESAVSVELQRNGMPPAKYARLSDRLNKAASVHSCLHDLYRAREHAKAEITQVAVKQASATWAIPEAGVLPISTKLDIKRSVELFCEQRANYPYPWRSKAASALLRAAKSCGVELNFDQRSMLDASAGYGFGMPAPMARQLAWRAGKIANRNPTLAANLYTTAADLAAARDMDPLVLRGVMKLACSVADEVDDKYDLRVYYGRELEFPEDVAFTTTSTKMAAAVATLIEIGQDIYLRGDIRKVKRAAVAILGVDFADKVTTGAYLDPDKLDKHIKEADAEVLKRVMHGFGVSPVSQDVHHQASIVPSREMERWLQIADGLGSDLEEDMNGGFKIRFKNPSSMGIGSDQRS